MFMEIVSHIAYWLVLVIGTVLIVFGAKSKDKKKFRQAILGCAMLLGVFTIIRVIDIVTNLIA